MSLFFFPIFLITANKKANLYSEFEKDTIPHLDALYNFALSLTGSKYKAYHLLKKTYIKAYTFFDKLDKSINTEKWLFRILRNTYYDYRNKSKKDDKPDFKDAENFFKNVLESSIDREALKKENYYNLTDDEISQSVSSLPEELKIVLILCDILNFNYEETADFVDVPAGIVTSRLYRARKILFTKILSYTQQTK